MKFGLQVKWTNIFINTVRNSRLYTLNNSIRNTMKSRDDMNYWDVPLQSVSYRAALVLSYHGNSVTNRISLLLIASDQPKKSMTTYKLSLKTQRRMTFCVCGSKSDLSLRGWFDVDHWSWGRDNERARTRPMRNLFLGPNDHVLYNRSKATIWCSQISICSQDSKAGPPVCLFYTCNVKHTQSHLPREQTNNREKPKADGICV